MYVILELTETQQAQVNALLQDTSADGPIIAQCYPDGIICKRISIKMAKQIQAVTGHVSSNEHKTLKERMVK